MLTDTKPFDIFKQDILWLFVFADAYYVSEESTSRVEFALPFPNSGKRLAREPASEKIKIRKLFFVNSGNITPVFYAGEIILI